MEKRRVVPEDRVMGAKDNGDFALRKRIRQREGILRKRELVVLTKDHKNRGADLAEI